MQNNLVLRQIPLPLEQFKYLPCQAYSAISNEVIYSVNSEKNSQLIQALWKRNSPPRIRAGFL